MAHTTMKGERSPLINPCPMINPWEIQETKTILALRMHPLLLNLPVPTYHPHPLLVGRTPVTQCLHHRRPRDRIQRRQHNKPTPHSPRSANALPSTNFPHINSTSVPTRPSHSRTSTSSRYMRHWYSLEFGVCLVSRNRHFCIASVASLISMSLPVMLEADR